MNKYLVLSIALLLPSMMHGERKVYLNNKTKSNGDFYVHTSLAGCCYGCGAEGKCKEVIEAGKSGQHTFKWECAGACIKCVSAKLYVGNKTVELSFDLEKAANSLFRNAMANGMKPGAVILDQPNFFNPGSDFVAGVGLVVLTAGSLGGIVVGTVDVIRFQCTSMEISLEQRGDGDKADDYVWSYKKR